MKRGSSKQDEVEEELSFYERMGKKFQKNMIIKAMSNVIGHYVLEHFGVEVPQWLQITIMIVFMTCPIWILILMVLCGEFDQESLEESRRVSKEMKEERRREKEKRKKNIKYD